MSQSQGTEADTCQPTHTFKDAIFTPGEEVTNIIAFPSLPPFARARHVDNADCRLVFFQFRTAGPYCVYGHFHLHAG